jgi:hypothetical protein
VSTTDFSSSRFSYAEVEGRPIWFSEVKPSPTTKTFYSVTIDPITNAKLTATLNTDEKKSIAALSNNFKCAVIYDTTGSGSVKIYDFSITNADVTVTASRTIPIALYTGINVADPSTSFEISDNCNAVRINNVFLHYNAGSYSADTLPTGTNLVNPVSSEDLSIVVAQNGIYVYNPTSRTYNLFRNETYQTSKKVWRDMGNLVIFTWEPQPQSSGNYNYKL